MGPCPPRPRSVSPSAPSASPTTRPSTSSTEELPEPRGRPGAAARRLPLARPLHARPHERREVVRRPRSRSADVHRRRHRVRGRGVALPGLATRGRLGARPTPVGRPTRGRATAQACAASTRAGGPGLHGARRARHAGLHGVRRAARDRPSAGRARPSSSRPPPGPWARPSARSPGSRAPAPSASPVARRSAASLSRSSGSTRPSTTGRRPSPRTWRRPSPDGIDVYFENVGGAVDAAGRCATLNQLRPDPGLRAGRGLQRHRARPRGPTGCRASWAWCCAAA